MNIRQRWLTFAAVQLACANSASAAAWTSDKGHGQVILTTSWFESSSGYNQQGGSERFANGGRFRKFDVNPYIEYGVTNRTTVILNAFVPTLRYSDQFGAFGSAGLGDVEAGVRRRLTSAGSRTVVSLQGITSFPAYSETRTPPPGNHQVDFEPRLMIGRGYDLENKSVFWNAETAFRLRTGAPADQVRFDGTLGANLNRRVMLLGQTFSIKGLRNGSRLKVGTNPNVQSDFDVYKIQLSAVFRVSSLLRVQTAWFRTVAGRNTGMAEGLLLSFWHSF